MNVIVKHHESEEHNHISGVVNDYVTLCGLDGNDTGVDQYGVQHTKQPVDCPTCIAIWEMCKTIKKKDIKS